MTSNLIIHLQSAGNEEIYENYLKRDQEFKIEINNFFIIKDK